MVRCPGQDQRFWKPDAIFEVDCSSCGKAVEFFKDEPQLKCRHCGHMVINPKIDLGCAEWCQYAEQCLGVRVGSLIAVRDKLVDEMKRTFGQDEKRINHALAVLDYAEQIQAVEGGDPLVVKAAAILHDIGIHEAERKYGSPAGKYQEIEGPPIAEEILKKHDVPAEVIEHVCRIIANHHSAKDIDTKEFWIVRDADWLVNIPEDFPVASKEKLQRIIDKTIRTPEGRRIAMESLMTNEGH
ncbi:MAG: hypothetical protein A2Z25_08555 [Planctomycetes bacterium RBG_16_55_9]|nr:MAG: hypothetical protein A2Z25_08555 [Planctomycetes bacterium RBG_16_55_9]